MATTDTDTEDMVDTEDTVDTEDMVVITEGMDLMLLRLRTR